MEPVGRLLETMVVLPGQYCRLNNLSSHGTFLEDEQFEVGGKLVTRKAGTSAKGLMNSYVKIRSSHPQLFEHIDLYQQPAAVIDGVLLQWRLRRLAERFPCSVWQRDCLATYFTPEATAALHAAQQIQSRVAADMTPVCQLVDTTIAKPTKDILTRQKEDLRNEMKMKCISQGRAPSTKRASDVTIPPPLEPESDGDASTDGTADVHASEWRWRLLVKRLQRLRQLRRLWGNLGRFLQPFAKLK